MNKLINTTAILSIVLSLSACGGGYSGKRDGGTNEAGTPQVGPIFDPANGLIPSTNNLLFSGSEDGTLNIPNPSNNPLINQINTLDGFSTTNPILADFGTPIDATTLKIGETVRVFDITSAPASINELGPTEILALVPPGQPNSLAIIPLQPLDSGATYAVVLTNGIQDTSGDNSTASLSYLLTKGATPLNGSFAALEPVREINNGVESLVSALATPPVTTSDIVLSWTFKTQSVGAILDSVLASAKAEAITMSATGFNSPLNAAAIHAGTLEVPYYLEVPTATNPLAPLNGYWKGIGGSNLSSFNPTPIANTTLTIPVLMTIPNVGTKPSNGWPIVIFQHGITQFRSNVLAIADSLAAKGFAAIAIDLPLHGEKETSPFHTTIEPTFNVDYVNETTGVPVPGPDMVPDSSGAHFINLQNILASRDNVKQGVSNLLTLRRSLEKLPDIDPDKVGFIAHSLGGIVGTTYLGVETLVTPTSLVTTGGSITDILKNSETRAQPIIDGLNAAGVTGEAAVAQYFGAAQAIVDSADPVNYASSAVAKHPIHLIEVLGDKTVPNIATERLAALMGASAGVSSTTTGIAPGNAGLVRFISGNHSSVLDPTLAPSVTGEMQNQLVEFQLSNGSDIKITNIDLIKQ